MLATIFNGVEIAHIGALIILGDMRKPKSKIVAIDVSRLFAMLK